MHLKFISLFLSLAILFAIAHLFFELPLVWSGMSVFIAFLITLPTLTSVVKIQVFCLSIIGAIGLIYSYYLHANIDLTRVVTINLPLIIIVLSSSMLKLICIPSSNPKQARGNKGVFQSLISTHLFSSVINISSVYMAGDFFHKTQKFNTIHSRILTRAFVLSMLWSPMMAGMAIGLTWSPNASMGLLIFYGAPLALIGLLITLYEIKIEEKSNLNQFKGISIAVGDMKIPLMLTFFVLFINNLIEISSVPFLVASSVIGFVFVIQVLTTGKKAPINIWQYSNQQLPSMKNEMALFFSAGVFSQGVVAALSTIISIDTEITLQSYHFGMILVAVISVSYIGIHPLASIAIIGSFIQNMDFEANIMALTLIAAWSLGSLANPFSGITMAMTQRYSLPIRKIQQSNKKYVLFSLLIYFSYLYLLKIKINYLL